MSLVQESPLQKNCSQHHNEGYNWKVAAHDDDAIH